MDWKEKDPGVWPGLFLLLLFLFYGLRANYYASSFHGFQWALGLATFAGDFPKRHSEPRPSFRLNIAARLRIPVPMRKKVEGSGTGEGPSGVGDTVKVTGTVPVKLSSSCKDRKSVV